MDQRSKGNISQSLGFWSTAARLMARTAVILAGAVAVGFMAGTIGLFVGGAFGQSFSGWRIGLLLGIPVGALAVAYLQSSHKRIPKLARLWTTIAWLLVARAAVVAANAVVVGFFVGLLGCFVAMNYGNGFEFAGKRGYEAAALIGFLLGSAVGAVAGALVMLYRLRKEQ